MHAKMAPSSVPIAIAPKVVATTPKGWRYSTMHMDASLGGSVFLSYGTVLSLTCPIINCQCNF